jgi:hypothetical protein
MYMQFSCSPFPLSGDTVSSAQAYSWLHSCKQIMDQYKADRHPGSLSSGNYLITTEVIDPSTGKSTKRKAQVWCDMATDGGGCDIAVQLLLRVVNLLSPFPLSGTHFCRSTKAFAQRRSATQIPARSTACNLRCPEQGITSKRC